MYYIISEKQQFWQQCQNDLGDTIACPLGVGKTNVCIFNKFESPL